MKEGMIRLRPIMPCFCLSAVRFVCEGITTRASLSDTGNQTECADFASNTGTDVTCGRRAKSHPRRHISGYLVDIQSTKTYR